MVLDGIVDEVGHPPAVAWSTPTAGPPRYAGCEGANKVRTKHQHDETGNNQDHHTRPGDAVHSITRLILLGVAFEESLPLGRIVVRASVENYYWPVTQ